MSFYIINSECGGRRPVHLEPGHQFSRTDLLAQMLRRRHAARFLVAPPCFGKTTLVAEYAQSVFAFESTFWIKAQSPNFIRDLDKDEIAFSILDACSVPGLVVFDDVPRLGAKRAKILSATLDRLMENGWEVILAMTPACDGYGKLQSDRVLIESRDLLLSDDEIMRIRDEVELSRKPASSYHQFDRIPCFFWQADTTTESIFKKLFSEELSAELFLYLFVMLVLGKGNLNIISRFISSNSQRILLHLERYYLYLGVNIQEGVFSTYHVPVEDIARKFLSFLDRMVSKSTTSSKDSLVIALADALVEERDPQRACQLVRMLSAIISRKEWLEKQSTPLFVQACFYEPYLVYQSLSLAGVGNIATLSTAHVWRLHYLGDSDAAVRLAGRVVHMSTANDEDRAIASLFLALEGTEASQARAIEQLDTLVMFSDAITEYGFDEGLDRLLEEKKSGWHQLIVGYLCVKRGFASGLDYLLRTQGEAEVIALIASQLLLSMCDAKDAKELAQDYDHEGVQKFEEVIHRCISFIEETESTAEIRAASFPQTLLFHNLEQAIRLFSPHRKLEVTRSYRLSTHRVEMFLFAQKNSYEQKTRETEASKQGILSEDKQSTKEVDLLAPLLKVKLFGGLEIIMGEHQLDPRTLSRQKDKTLLALLVLNKGKEISRDRLIEMLWPGVLPSTSLRSFYSVWSRLRRALKTPTGDCPYLIRLQTSCKIDARLVHSDVSEFDDICRRLSFGSADISAWEHYYEQLSGLYTDDLLPGEYENEAIVNSRNEYRDRMVDACVTGANYLLERERPKAALWFARLATERDNTREDAYEVLMKSQIGAGQRTAALGTFFKCKGYLAEELGIDPSVKLTALYNGIVQEDPALLHADSGRYLNGGFD